MPKFGAHIIIGEMATKKRPELFDKDIHDNIFRLGSVGPDLTLFLFDPIKNPDVRKGFDAATGILASIQDINDQLNAIAKLFEGPHADLMNWVTGGLSKDLTGLLETGLDAMILAIKLGAAIQSSPINLQNPLAKLIREGKFDKDLLSNPDYANPSFLIDITDNYGFPFRHFGHPYTDDGKWKQPEPMGDYSNWWWMDMLHYRKTGAFAQALLKNATDPIKKSYAQGYLSHVAGDICGHPYINALVEGPFRNHAYRHIVLETLADTWLWDDVGRGDILDSNLHKIIKLDSFELEKIGDLLISAMKEVYKDPMLPDLLPNRYPSNADIESAYERMSLYLRLSTSGGTKRPEPPPDDAQGLMDEIRELLANNNPGNPPTYNPHDPLTYLLAVLGWLLRGATFLAMIASLQPAMLARFLNIAPRWLIYLIQTAIFELTSGLRSLLVLMGYGYASNEDFETFGFLDNFVKVDLERLNNYPRKSMPLPKLPFYWLVPPHNGADLESPYTFVGPIQKNATPAWMIDPLNKMDVSIDLLNKLIQAKTPEATRDLELLLKQHKSLGFGNAVDFYIAIIEGKLDIPDMDLDGDRGYAYKAWEELPPNERYI